MRLLRHYINYFRGGALEFDWIHPTAVDVANVAVTTPVQLQWLHGLYDGQWVYTASSPNAGINDRSWQVTVLSANTVSLRGSTASGPIGAAMVWTYVPHMKVALSDDTLASPATLMGPEQLAAPNFSLRGGNFNLAVTLEELF